MAKTIKVIDLLNKIANGEDVPENIKFDNTIWKYNKTKTDYQDTGSTRIYFFAELVVYNKSWLNDTVEIIEEQQDIDIQEIEELEMTEVINHRLVKEIRENRELLNALVQAVKQLDRQIKDKE